jgi:hypothetical protein
MVAASSCNDVCGCIVESPVLRCQAKERFDKRAFRRGLWNNMEAGISSPNVVRGHIMSDNKQT